MSNLDKATLGGGCFWCVEAVFQQLSGVTSVVSGYCGGQIESPTYEDICTGTSGHAEVIQITYDLDQVSYSDILQLFWKSHDPTTLNRQGADAGTQYRSVIYYHNEEQKEIAESSKATAQVDFADEIVTEITVLPQFFEAEPYHQNYYRSNSEAGYCQMIIEPKLRKLYKTQ